MRNIIKAEREDPRIYSVGAVTEELKDHIYCDVADYESYINLDESEREWRGLYKVPLSLPFDIGAEETDWDKFDMFVKKNYPIQWFFRGWLFTVDDPMYHVIWNIYDEITDIKFAIKNFARSFSQKYYKANPRHIYSDPSEVIVRSNFAIITDFYYYEVVDGHVDWQATEHHKEFYDWLVSAVKDIEGTIPSFDKDEKIGHKLARERKGEPYNIRYKEVNDAEAKREALTDDILSKMVKYRHYFWT